MSLMLFRGSLLHIGLALMSVGPSNVFPYFMTGAGTLSAPFLQTTTFDSFGLGGSEREILLISGLQVAGFLLLREANFPDSIRIFLCSYIG
mgnify:CR=1 FL=1